MMREERRELEKEGVEDVDWECEEELVIGKRESTGGNLYVPWMNACGQS